MTASRILGSVCSPARDKTHPKWIHVTQETGGKIIFYSKYNILAIKDLKLSHGSFFTEDPFYSAVRASYFFASFAITTDRYPKPY